jgi:hypothetical protein
MPSPKGLRSSKVSEREAATPDISRIALFLQSHLGQKVTAYLSGVDNAKAVRLWASGKAKPRVLSKTRLQVAYQAARLLTEAYDDETAKAWFFGCNTLLDDDAPAYVLRYGRTLDDLSLVLQAAHNFVAIAAPALVEVR